MRTTLTLDDDVLQAAKELAASRGLTTGRVISDLARAALTPVGGRACATACFFCRHERLDLSCPR